MTQQSVEAIYVIEALDVIRKRPHMYAGPLDAEAPNRIMVEALCLAFRAGCIGLSKSLIIDIFPGGRASIESDAPWPNTLDPKLSHRAKREVRKPEIILTQLYACRELEDYQEGKFCTNGIVTVNALSTTFRFENYCEGHRWLGTFFQGTMVDVYECMEPSDREGSLLVFQLDGKLLPHIEFDAKQLYDTVMGKRPAGLSLYIRDNVNKVIYQD